MQNYKYINIPKHAKMYENMKNCLKICKNFSKYATTHQNMQKICKNPKYAKQILNFCLIYSFFGSFKPLALF